MRNILFFDNMITPKIITFIYWLMLIMAVIGGFASIFAGPFSIGKFFMGLGYILGGIIFARVWCELMIVFFKMNEALQELRRK